MLWNVLARSAWRKTAIIRQSVTFHYTFNAALAIPAKNSSSRVAFFAHDHFGTNDIRDRFYVKCASHLTPVPLVCSVLFSPTLAHALTSLLPYLIPI